MWSESFQKWDGRGVFLLRLDYGYSVDDAGGGERGRGAVDLERLPLAHLEEFLLAPPGPGGIRTLERADRLASLGRRRGGSEIWATLGHAGGAGGLLLLTRFPRTSQAIDRRLRETGLWAGAAENEVRGELPPLYTALEADSPLFRLHLAFEWETGLAHARATTVLSEAGALMALRGIVTPAQLAVGLSSTAGAARSYLNWMVEAGLARRTATGFALRHPALGALFEGEAPARAAEPPDLSAHAPPPAVEGGGLPPTLPPSGSPPPLAPPPGPRWDPSEMD